MGCGATASGHPVSPHSRQRSGRIPALPYPLREQSHCSPCPSTQRHSGYKPQSYSRPSSFRWTSGAHHSKILTAAQTGNLSTMLPVQSVNHPPGRAMMGPIAYQPSHVPALVYPNTQKYRSATE